MTQNQRTLAIDWGQKRTGFAICDELGMTVRPLETVRGPKETVLQRVVELISDYDVQRIVVGVPLGAEGQIREAAERILALVEELKGMVTCPVYTWNERLTSYAADEWMRERGYSARERQQRSDEIAAAILLEDFLASCPFPS